jgi:hypothetical protein
MKKLALLALFVVTVLMFQNCKKSSDDTVDTVSPLLQASVNGAAWTPDTLSATVTYNAAAKTKVLNISGTKTQKQVNIVITSSNATNTADFGVTTYTVDATLNPLMTYATQQKDATTGAYSFVVQGTADQSGGSITISSIDATNKTITGSFNFSTRKITYDGLGNVVSVSTSTISGGTFTNLPYSFVSK